MPGLPQKASQGRRERFTRRPDDARCCAEPEQTCPSTGECCTAVSKSKGASDACEGRATALECSRAYPEEAEAALEYCVWLGGRCTLGSSADCRDAYDPGASSYYGEVAGFERECASGDCPAFARAMAQYAAAHTQATTGTAPPEGMEHARLLVINDHWRNVGMGFMPTRATTGRSGTLRPSDQPRPKRLHHLEPASRSQTSPTRSSSRWRRACTSTLRTTVATTGRATSPAS